MKKYIMPTTKVVEISNEELLAGSLGRANDSQGYGTTGGFAKGRGGDDCDWVEDEDF